MNRESVGLRILVFSALLGVVWTPGAEATSASNGSPKVIVCRSSEGYVLTVERTGAMLNAPHGDDFSALPRTNASIELKTPEDKFEFPGAYLVKDKSENFRVHAYATGDEGYISSIVTGQINLDPSTRKYYLTAKFRLNGKDVGKSNFQHTAGKRPSCELK